ncbi:MAG: SnoaL-like domain, partial [Solirubrobacteraceae bacterium]|nr:SnoaL-like domain [Solirubrobacteraceae bacterium]
MTPIQAEAGPQWARRVSNLRPLACEVCEELVRKQVEALNRGDLDGVMSSVAEDGVLDGRADLIEGRAAIRGFIDEWFGAYEELDYELEEVSHLGGGVVFTVVIQDGRLVGSDGRVRQR